MQRWIAAVLLAPLCAGCLGGGTKSNSLPQLDRTLVGDYAATVQAVSGHLHSYSSGVSNCTSGTYTCIFDVVSAGAAARFLMSHLAADGALADPTKVIPSPVTSLVATTQKDAVDVNRAAAGMSTFARASLVRFRATLSALLTDVDNWQPAGIAGRLMTSDHVSIPTAPPPNLHVRFNVRPLLYIKQNPYFATFTKSGSHCEGAGPLSDLKHGASVTIYNAAGRRVIGIGYVVRSFVSGNRCGLVADVKGLPPEPFYQVRFTNRNKVAFSARALVTQSGYSAFG